MIFRLALATSLFGVSPLLAEPIALQCDGRWWDIEHAIFGQPINDQSLLIDLKGGTVSGSLGSFRIKTVNDSQIRFSAPLVEKEKETGLWSGGIDPTTGLVSVVASREGGDTYIFVYNLDCKPADVSGQ